MKVGVTGHQERPGIEWRWVRSAITDLVGEIGRPVVGFTSLAIGADQVFAEVVLSQAGRLVAVVPRDDYERFFRGDDLVRYRELLARSNAVVLQARDEDRAFLEAGLYIVDKCDRLLAVWDGEPSRGEGGTANVVDHARRSGRPWVHIDPLRTSVTRHGC